MAYYYRVTSADDYAHSQIKSDVISAATPTACYRNFASEMQILMRSLWLQRLPRYTM